MRQIGPHNKVRFGRSDSSAGAEVTIDPFALRGSEPHCEPLLFFRSSVAWQSRLSHMHTRTHRAATKGAADFPGSYPSYLLGQAHLGGGSARRRPPTFSTSWATEARIPLSRSISWLIRGSRAALPGDTGTRRKGYRDFFALWRDAAPGLADLHGSESWTSRQFATVRTVEKTVTGSASSCVHESSYNFADKCAQLLESWLADPCFADSLTWERLAMQHAGGLRARASQLPPRFGTSSSMGAAVLTNTGSVRSAAVRRYGPNEGR
jgi:hypothetical protein